MALNLGNWIRDPIKFDTGLGDLVNNFREGQKMREDREKYGQEREGRGYGNMIKAAEAMYAPQNAEATLSLVQAQMENQQAQALQHKAAQEGLNISNEEARMFLNELKSRMGGRGNQTSQSAPNYPTNNGTSSYPVPPQQGFNGTDELVPNTGIVNTNQNFELAGEPNLPLAGENLSSGQADQLGRRPPKNQKGGMFDFSDQDYGALLRKRGYTPDPVEEARAKGINEVSTKRYESAIGSMESAAKTLDTIAKVEDIYNNFPKEVLDAVGPLNANYLAKYMGWSEAATTLGALESLSGEMQSDMVKAFGGQAKEVEFNLADRTKYNPRDKIQLSLGKLAAIKNMMQLKYDRDRSIAEDISNGYGAHDAEAYARKRFPAKGISDQLREAEQFTRRAKGKKDSVLPGGENPFTQKRDQAKDERLKAIFGTSDPMEMF